MSAIISSADFNFWDDIALKSYAEVVSKRHSQLGINFEEELLSKFPFTKEALKDIMSWESNREFVEKYEEKRNIGKH